MNEFLPTNCPSCDHPLMWRGVDLVCGGPECIQTSRMAVASFIKKYGIDGASEVSLENWGIDSMEDLLKWVPGKGKAEQNFYKDFVKKVFHGFDEFVFLSRMYFGGVGERIFDKLIHNCGDLISLEDTVKDPRPSNLPSGIGMAICKKIAEKWDSNYATMKTFGGDPRVTVKMQEEPKMKTERSNKLESKFFLITGTLSCGRTEFEGKITDAGGKIASGVSKKLDYLIIGDKPGNNKLEKAEKLGIKTISEHEFMGMIS